MRMEFKKFKRSIELGHNNSLSLNLATVVCRCQYKTVMRPPLSLKKAEKTNGIDIL